jgi:uncharacterized protein YbaP (TraB family)
MMNMRSIFSLAVALLMALPASARADDRLPIWQVDGERNRVYLLGSIHLLRQQDYPLPAGFDSVYEDAEKLIMELDMDDMDPVESQALANQMGLIQDGRTLKDLLGEETYAEAESLAEASQVPISLLAGAEPWFAAMNVEVMLLMRMGFNPNHGVETYFQEKAVADGKEILGLETMRQQLEFLDGLSAQAQRDMFMQSLSEGAELREIMDATIAAWRTGDVDFMESELLGDMAQYAELNEVIVGERNIDWTVQIEALLDDDIDYLVVVGALHLVGDEGVPGLLEARGHAVTQLTESEN